MTTSYNGWPASPKAADVHAVPLVVAGVEFVGGVRSGDVHTVLGYVADQFHDRVEKLESPGCWGYFFRKNRNADDISCHGSATAIDCNAPRHNNGHEATTKLGGFTKAQVAEIHKILAEVPELAEVVHWGGDWHTADGLVPDPMHFEIHDHDTAKLARVVNRIALKEDDMAYTDWPKKDQQALAQDVAHEVLRLKQVSNRNPAGDLQGKRSLAATLTDIEATQDTIRQDLAAIKKAVSK